MSNSETANRRSASVPRFVSHRRSLFAFALLAGLATVRASAQNDEPKYYTAADLSQVDVDFAYQGEFHGTIWADWEHRTGAVIALQVVALGDGKFDAKLFGGGFPGIGWNGIEPTRLSGTLDATGFVMLRGSPFVVIVGDRFADVYYENGLPAGQIAKIQRVSPTEDALPPWGATVLYNGSDTEQFLNGRISRDGFLMEGTELKPLFQDYTLHVEFMLPYMPKARGQARANSGVYLQSRYEVQILDSFGLEGEDNECGGLYKFRRPDVNMCYPPLTWQTYDIVFTSPRFAEDGTKTQDADITVYQNGVAIHDHAVLARKTGGGAQEAPDLLPIKLQDHGNPVRFRNIWIVDDAKPTGSPYPPYARHEQPYAPWGINLTPQNAAAQRWYPDWSSWRSIYYR